MINVQPNQVYSKKEVAKMFEVTVQTINNWCRQNDGKAELKSRNGFISAKSILEYIEGE